MICIFSSRTSNACLYFTDYQREKERDETERDERERDERDERDKRDKRDKRERPLSSGVCEWVVWVCG